MRRRRRIEGWINYILAIYNMPKSWWIMKEIVKTFKGSKQTIAKISNDKKGKNQVHCSSL